MSTSLSEPNAPAAEALSAAATAGEGRPQAGGAATSAGALLREARQKKGLHIAALAVMLKVPQAKLEALEADRWQDLPDMTFARALAKTVCRALKLDAEGVLRLLPASKDPELNVSRGLNQPYRDRGGLGEGFSLAWLSSPVALGVLALLAAAGALFLLPADLLQKLSTPSTVADNTPVLLSPAPEVSAASAASGALAAVPEALSASASAQAMAVNARLGPLVPAAASAAPAPAPLASAPAAKPAAPAASSVPPAKVEGQAQLRVKITDESWVEVVDARGQVLLSKLLRPGDEQHLQGLPPLKIRVGNVAGTELSLRGAVVDLKALSRDNVARIELN
ncbi:cytoskeleton protein RodZ [Paucibacter oligotrophus]|uniref:Cytoskeleton protein RodZ n=1 Tax=Roseateles oligotrophus TaxID=1769250 RepID=A0A840L101_9BURK|nr:helix-turn-helix domain-containing protein [Roseateles oligotrophus]MBB4842114.1 cytoskeleton protein RodZ [Roseateles oligotrophus]